jgi:hypothetical protein
MSTKATDTISGAAEDAGGAAEPAGGAAEPVGDTAEPAGGGEGRGPILVGVSATSGSPAALRWALEQAHLQSLPLMALRAYRVPTTAAGTVRPTPSRVADSEDPLRSAALESLEADVRRRSERRPTRSSCGPCAARGAACSWTRARERRCWSSMRRADVRCAATPPSPRSSCTGRCARW